MNNSEAYEFGQRAYLKGLQVPYHDINITTCLKADLDAWKNGTPGYVKAWQSGWNEEMNKATRLRFPRIYGL